VTIIQSEVLKKLLGVLLAAASAAICAAIDHIIEEEGKQ